jgi:hypothetical protein
VAKSYSRILFQVFAGNESRFEDSKLQFRIESTIKFTPTNIQMRYGSAERSVLQIKSSENREELEISLIVEKDGEELPARHLIERMLRESVSASILGMFVPKPFLASAERTGAAIFQKELDFTKNRLVEMLGDKSTKLHPIHFLSKFSGEYPIAVSGT